VSTERFILGVPKAWPSPAADSPAKVALRPGRGAAQASFDQRSATGPSSDILPGTGRVAMPPGASAGWGWSEAFCRWRIEP